ncbi:MAG TPA: F0F1 ATP synthase subunit delta [Streptosporangiaceae bacterium]
MRGASRASLAQASEQLSAVATSKATADTVGDELFAVVRLLDSEHGLRRALTDPARQAEAKAGLARSLLDGRVSAQTLDLVAGLASARWSAARDLADAAEELAVKAVVIAAEQAGNLDDLEDDLFRFGRVTMGQPELYSALTNPYLPGERKQGLLNALLDGKVSAEAERLITQAALEPRGRSLEANLDSYANAAAERRQRLVAVVRVASALSREQQDRLAAALAAIYGHDVFLNIVLDPHVVGGMSVQVGDEFIDASVASRLAAVRRKLAS